MSESELERARSFRFDRDRNRYVAARSILRELLGAALGCAPAVVPIRTGTAGAPLPIDDLYFNLSHSGDLAGFALVRGRRVGIDVELPRTGVEPVAAAFHPLERARIAQAPAAARDREVLRYWTAKEAYLKALGVGLLRPLDAFSVDLDAEGGPVLVDAAPPSGSGDDWELHELAAPRGALAALVVERRGRAKRRRPS